jgi:hypothetical protein
MNISDKQTFICQKATERKVKWTRHALGKLASEPVSTNDVETALQGAKIIEEYPHLHRHLPDCLVLAFISPDRPIHCVTGINEPQDYILMVTIYQPTAQEWKNDWQTRK